ncbi:MAG TPA: type II toxin-antitoxin system RelE/ParE family toxin [Acidobacteriota bacterium]|nr:type II toxin-antitoxin system RelE/ParE family toxin [Acidobacteriota bacterium]
MLPTNWKIEEHVTANGRSRFGDWFKSLDASAAARVAVALYRLEKGNFGSVKSLGGDLFEVKLPFGPGYRIYFGRKEQDRIILLAGGTKRRQRQDIRRVQFDWRDYQIDKEES